MLIERASTPEFTGGEFYRYTALGLDKHPWIVISDPALAEYQHKIIVVNFTSWAAWKDQTCIVDVHECPPGTLDRRSCVEYAGCEFQPLGTLEERLYRGHLRKCGVANDELLARLRQGAIDSQFTLNKFRDVLIDQGLAFPF